MDKTAQEMQRFFEASSYTALVDRKKLAFVHTAVRDYAGKTARSMGSLRVLDAACGSGGVALPLATLGCRVRGFDLAAEDVHALESTAKERGLTNLTLSVDNGFTFDDGEMYDLLILSEVLEHVLEPERLLANLVRRMLPGGYLVVTVPNGYGPWEMRNRIDPYQWALRSNLLRRLMGRRPFVFGGGEAHCQFYTLPRISRILTNQSLRILAKAKSDTLLTVLPLARRTPIIAKWDIRLADRLPFGWANGWYFLCESVSP